MIRESRAQKLYASHHQFYVEDARAPGDTGHPDFWTKQASQDALAVIAGTIGIGTGSYATVEVNTEIHDTEPPVQLDDWDHVTEAGLTITSGVLRVVGCLDDGDGEEFAVASGSYRVRCCHANLAGLEEFGEGKDWYLVQVWPSGDASRQVLKRWSAPGR